MTKEELINTIKKKTDDAGNALINYEDGDDYDYGIMNGRYNALHELYTIVLNDDTVADLTE